MAGPRKARKPRSDKRSAPSRDPVGRSSESGFRLTDLQRSLGNQTLLRFLDPSPDLSESFALRSEIPPPEVTRTASGTIRATVYFGQDEFLLDSRGFRVVEELSRELPFLYEPTVRVDGHASPEGSEKSNLALSENRRLAVVSILNSQTGRSGGFEGQGYGETKPAVTDSAENPSPYNRRVEIWIVPSPAPVKEPEVPLIPRFTPHFKPETDEERLNRILREPTPAFERPKISIAGAVRRRYDEFMDRALARFGVPREHRERVKDLVADALTGLGEKALDGALDQTGLDKAGKDALKNAIKAGARTEFEIP